MRRRRLGRWLDRASDITFIVTSREALHLRGEQVVALGPLSFETDGIELFATRARAQRPDFAMTESNRSAVAEVVRLVDGLPLGIELAAARVRVLSPKQLGERMRNRFAVLRKASRSEGRQATLKATIDWSWDLLTPGERTALAQCSVFEGGFALDAVEAVIDLAPFPEAPATLDVIEALVDKSLLRAAPPAEPGGRTIEEPRLGMYLSIHDYAATKLDERGPEARVAAEIRHGRYFAGQGSVEALDALDLHGGVERRSRLALDLDNLIAACSRAVGRADGESAAKACCAAVEVLLLRGPMAPGLALADEVLEMSGLTAAQRAAVFSAKGSMLQLIGRIAHAEAAFEQALAGFRDVRDPRGEAQTLRQFGSLRRNQGRLGDAVQLHSKPLWSWRVRLRSGASRGNCSAISASCTRNRAGWTTRARSSSGHLAIHREVGNRRSEGNDTSNLGNARREQGRLDESLGQFERALGILREVGNRRVEGIVLSNLGLLQADHGNVAEARIQLESALAIAREIGHRVDEGAMLDVLGCFLRDRGLLAEARAHFDRALTIHRAAGNTSEEGVLLGSIGDLLARQGDFAAGTRRAGPRRRKAARSRQRTRPGEAALQARACRTRSRRQGCRASRVGAGGSRGPVNRRNRRQRNRAQHRNPARRAEAVGSVSQLDGVIARFAQGFPLLRHAAPVARRSACARYASRTMLSR